MNKWKWIINFDAGNDGPFISDGDFAYDIEHGKMHYIIGEENDGVTLMVDADSGETEVLVNDDDFLYEL